MTILRILPVFLLATLISTAAFSQTSPIGDLAGKSAIGYRFGGIDFDGASPAEDIDYSHSVAFTQMFTNNLGMEIEGSYLKGDDDGSAYSLFADLLYKFPLDDIPIAPYVRGGVGVADTRHVEDAFDDFDKDESIAWRAGGGVEYYLTRNVALDTEALYTWADSTFEDNWQYRAGVKYYF